MQNAIKNVQTGAGAITRRFVSVSKDIWASTVELLYATRSAWTAEAVPRRESAAVLLAIKGAIVKEVIDNRSSLRRI